MLVPRLIKGQLHLIKLVTRCPLIEDGHLVHLDNYLGIQSCDELFAYYINTYNIITKQIKMNDF